MDSDARARVQTGLGDAAFVLVIAAGYLGFLSRRSPLSLLGAAVLAAGVFYTLLGLYGPALCMRAGGRYALRAYLGLQTVLGALILGAGQSVDPIILLPLVAQGVTLLPGREPWLLAALPMAAYALALARSGSHSENLRGSLGGLASLAFVVLTAQALARERLSRAQAARLAGQLAEANDKFRAHADQAEELAAAKERNRIAREMHDSLGHYLTAANMQLEAARVVLDSDRGRALEALGKAQKLTQEGLAEVRRAVAALRAAPVAGRSLPEAIAALLAEAGAAGVQTRMQTLGESRPLGVQAELALYRAAQEALTNMRKHSRASLVELTLDYADAHRVRLTVQDNGVGAAGTEGGFGLSGVQERVQALGGQATVRTAPGQGFALLVETPG
jgi:signal transduction histidine kinase